MDDLYFRIYGDYPGRDPMFYPREECPWLADMERHWPVVREEFEDFHYHRQQTLAPSYVPDDVEVQGWRSINFVTYRHWWRENCRHFPKTVAFIRSVPHVTSAFVNLLQPHSRLPAHNGDTNTTYRCHLGVIVPTSDVAQCGLEVGGARTGWQEGRAFAFNEAYRHEVWNSTDRDRVIMVLDVMKPAYRPRTLGICGAVLGAIALTGLETRYAPLRRIPPVARRGLHRALGWGASAVLYARDGVR